ncbi:MAG: hypothetical protein JWQ81_1702 [Amycolatopsis sp.]|jgi:hypothetical protein|nr:hypothetical protein [Amycolatopsis sp.]
MITANETIPPGSHPTGSVNSEPLQRKLTCSRNMMPYPPSCAT